MPNSTNVANTFYTRQNKCASCSRKTNLNYGICQNCWDRKKIRYHDQTPFLPIRGNRDKKYEFFGVELEIRGPSPKEHVAQLQKINLPANFGLDGGGTEIRFYPFGFKFYQQNKNKFKSYFQWLETKNAHWSTDSTGIHIHISKGSFNSDFHVYKFLSLIYHNKKEMELLAQRTSPYWANFNLYEDNQQYSSRDEVLEYFATPCRHVTHFSTCGNNGCSIAAPPHTNNRCYDCHLQYQEALTNITKPSKKNPLENTLKKVAKSWWVGNKHTYIEKYHAANTVNDNTIEIRIFRSTSSLTEFMAYIQFCKAALEYTRKIKNPNWAGFCKFVKGNNEIFTDLLSHLKNKDILKCA